MQDRQRQLRAFTLIELLTVVAIIAMLIAIFSVGAKKVRIISFGLQQKSAFHAMTVGLELFSNDFNGYPRSARTSNNNAAPFVTGAQHLAEALLGRDERGFEPLTGWYPPNDALYRPGVPADLYDTAAAGSLSLARRKGPYCEIKFGAVATVYNLWEGNNGPSQVYDSGAAPADVRRSPVITDVFAQNNTAAGRVGMPILYFKADSAKRFRVNVTRQTVPDSGYVETEYREWSYNFEDNLPILQLPWLRDTAQAGMDVHYRDPDNQGRNQARMFYEQITQQADPDRNFYRPFNANTFILISAGWDGIFGTKDDIVNFN